MQHCRLEEACCIANEGSIGIISDAGCTVGCGAVYGMRLLQVLYLVHDGTLKNASVGHESRVTTDLVLTVDGVDEHHSANNQNPEHMLCDELVVGYEPSKQCRYFDEHRFLGRRGCFK
jgi:hypothetical protein